MTDNGMFHHLCNGLSFLSPYPGGQLSNKWPTFKRNGNKTKHSFTGSQNINFIPLFEKVKIYNQFNATLCHFCVRGMRTQPLLICVGCSVHYCVPCAINKGGFFEIAFVVVVDTHLPRSEALAYVLPHFDELTHVVIRASSSVCWGLLFCLRKAFIF